MFQTIGYIIHMKKAIDFLCFYLPNFIDILLFGSSNPTGMIILPLGIYKLILKIFLIKSKKALKNQGFSPGIFFVTLLWWERVDSNHRSRRQQIYSLPPLATREHSHINLFCFHKIMELVDGLEPPTC